MPVSSFLLPGALQMLRFFWDGVWYEFLVLPFGIRLIIFLGVMLVVRRDGG